jgi:phosphomannomutase
MRAPITMRTSAMSSVFLDGLRLDGLRIVLDAANGAAHQIGPEVLRAAGAEVTVVAASPDGRNINDRCGATAPSLVAEAVLEHGADVGIALDGDADRLIAVDHLAGSSTATTSSPSRPPTCGLGERCVTTPWW